MTTTKTTTPAETLTFAEIERIAAPLLPIQQRRLLVSVLADSLAGKRPLIHVTYQSQTSSKKSAPGRDFVELPGVSYDVHNGPVTEVAVNKKGEIYFRLLSNTRINPKTGLPSPRALKPAGLTSITLLGYAAPAE